VRAPGGTVVLVGGPMGRPVLGPLGHIVRMRAASFLDRRRSVFFITSFSRADLEVLCDLVEAGSITPAVDRTYDLDSVAEALGYLGTGHARGKVVVRI
jgi:NADPH:quinone reductase-like Zn-dependent oxidoreductase